MLTDVPAPKRFVAVELNGHGATAFVYLRGAKAGERRVYFVDRVAPGAVTKAPMLLGQFLDEFEKCPEDALRLSPGGTNRLYFQVEQEHSGDRRVSAYDDLTPEEVRDTWGRLAQLAKAYPKAAELLKYLPP
jgi:hypothetical protein